MRSRLRRLAWIAAALSPLALYAGWRMTRLPGATEGPPPDSISHASLRGPAIAVAACLLIGVSVYAGWRSLAQKHEDEAVARAITGGDPDAAPALITRYGCGGCHAISGVPGADGAVAAPLTGLRKRVYIAGVLPNTPENLVRWIVEPQAVSPRTAMPATGITEREARDVAAYLYTQ